MIAVPPADGLCWPCGTPPVDLQVGCGVNFHTRSRIFDRPPGGVTGKIASLVWIKGAYLAGSDRFDTGLAIIAGERATDRR
ncbi:hypothetical protein [Pseudofrankia inefficax]|uniref:hypothetical protein n=1 Tax=Pseudofrankia inefficax (strain DSM 45817 / CECT 9037 / DDB 130130 / EuI1c) TaxID=298654 RepID=UPI0012FD6139|nr:hypothetical protein [Pseudofrankia inefficax]